MIDWILQPWPWYVAGPLIGLTVPLLLILSGQTFGVSSSLRHLGSACMPHSKIPYLRDNNWRQSTWSLLFVAGIVLGGFIGAQWLSAGEISLLPAEYYTPAGLLRLAVGGVLVGFGVRYAGGCTSGHTIMGVSMLNWPSMVASVFFFIGGLLSTHFIMTWLF